MVAIVAAIAATGIGETAIGNIIRSIGAARPTPTATWLRSTEALLEAITGGGKADRVNLGNQGTEALTVVAREASTVAAEVSMVAAQVGSAAAEIE